MALIREHLRYLEPYEDNFVRCHVELARLDEGYQAHLQLTLMRGDVIRVHADEDEPGFDSPGEALTASFARVITQLARARSTMPPEPRSGSAWTRV
ncbi:MAG TPA: HPF/RaiA family ribosome-associated protein [Polyangiales bacterium]|nr:HPF/RaiA family ribosome-associated protein [Polyangiales bacterium]